MSPNKAKALSHRDHLIQKLTEGLRSSLANIRTAIETIEEYPEMDSGQIEPITEDYLS